MEGVVAHTSRNYIAGAPKAPMVQIAKLLAEGMIEVLDFTRAEAFQHRSQPLG